MRDWWLIILALGALTLFIIIIWRARRTTDSTASQTAGRTYLDGWEFREA